MACGDDEGEQCGNAGNLEDEGQQCGNAGNLDDEGQQIVEDSCLSV